jgi:hypothetical protein
MPGRKHKINEPKLTKKHIHILKSCINNLIHPLFKEKTIEEFNIIVNKINDIFISHQLSNIYTITKLYDAISNRRYIIRKRNRLENNYYNIDIKKFSFEDISILLNNIDLPAF